MANWCSNVVWFEANETTLKKIKQMFLQMAGKEKETNCGQLPNFINEDGDWFFDIRWETEDVLYYESRWAPNIDVLKQIAEHYKVGFTVEYQETGNLVFGRATYSDKLLTDIYLEGKDFEKYQFDEETDTYQFEGKEYESDYEILETLLDRKLAQL